MSAHTPGPWFSKWNTNGYWQVRVYRGSPIADVVPRVDPSFESPADRATHQTAAADASLIAAAPDLLAACEAVRHCAKCADDYGRCSDCDAILSGVIAKARGGGK